MLWCKDSFDSSDLERSLFDVFKDAYGIRNVRVDFVDGSSLNVFKYNVLGLSCGKGVFNLYDNPSLDEALDSFHVEEVVRISEF